jgi:hypothetical protein
MNYVFSALPPAPIVVRATISGEPDSPTYLNTATLTVGGTDITIIAIASTTGRGARTNWSSQPINLTGLANGLHRLRRRTQQHGHLARRCDAPLGDVGGALELRGVVISKCWPQRQRGEPRSTFPDIIEFYNAGAGAVDLSACG